jgi:hypothetical protein
MLEVTMDHPDQIVAKARAGVRRVWLTVAALMVWPVALVMLVTYPEERDHWGKVAAASVGLAALAMAGAIATGHFPP